MSTRCAPTTIMHVINFTNIENLREPGVEAMHNVELDVADSHSNPPLCISIDCKHVVV